MPPKDKAFIVSVIDPGITARLCASPTIVTAFRLTDVAPETILEACADDAKLKASIATSTPPITVKSCGADTMPSASMAIAIEPGVIESTCVDELKVKTSKETVV